MLVNPKKIFRLLIRALKLVYRSLSTCGFSFLNKSFEARHLNSSIYFVVESPSIVVQPKDTWGEIGKKTVLHCLAKGDKPIEYSWYKDETLMTATGDLVVDQPDLVFLETIPEDAGVYYCKATNQVKKDGAKSTSARLKVFSKLK